MRHRIRIVPICALLALGVTGGVVGCSAGDDATTGDQVTGGPLASGSAAVACLTVASTGAAPTGPSAPTRSDSARARGDCDWSDTG